MNEKDQKLQRILELAKIADVLTPTQAREYVDLLVKLTTKQKESLIEESKKLNSEFADAVSQETFRQIKEALGVISEKHKDALLEVRQLSNKKEKKIDEKLKKVEDLINELQSIEVNDGYTPEKGVDYFTESDIQEIESNILSKIPNPKEYELFGENVVDSINALEITPDNQIDAKHIKNLPKPTQFIGGGSSGIKEIVAGTNIAVDKSNPQYPVVSSTGGGGSGDVTGPSSSTDNAIARFDGTTGKIIQNSGVTVGDNNGITGSVATGNGIVYSGATTGNLFKLTPSGATGTTAGTSGALLVDFTNIADGLAFQLYTNSDGATASYPQILLQADNATYNQPLLQITHKGTGGNAVHMRLDGPSPQIEWRETGGSGSAGNGQFETQVQGDIFFINGRNSSDTAFENSVWFLRPELGGSVGIGVNPYNIEKLTIGETTGNPARIAMLGTSAPTADTNYGKLWADSSTFLPKWMDSAGTNYDITLGTASQSLTNKRITFSAGTTTAGTAPIKLTSGTSMTTAEAGAIEFTTDNLFFTITTGTARKRILMANDVGGLTANYIPYVTTNGRLTNNANLQWDPTNARLGIGAVPQYRLDIIDTQTANSGTKHTTSSVNTFTPTGAAYTTNVDAYIGQVDVGAGTAVDSAASAFVRGVLGVGANKSGQAINTIYGVTGQAINSSTGSINSAYGAHGYIQNNAGGTINNAFGMFSEIRNTGAGTITSGVGLYVDVTKSAGTITTATGFKMIDFSATVGTQYGVLTYGKSKFGGFNNLPTRVLESEIEGSATNTIDYPFRISHSTSGTATTGFGVGQEFEAENASGTRKIIGTQEFYYSDATNATEDATYKLRLIKAGTLTDAFTVDSVGNTTLAGVVKTAGYTVATLPTGVAGYRAYVTDALAPVWGANVAGGGAVTIPVFYDGANWIVA